MSDLETMISRVWAQNDRLEQQVARLTEEADRGNEDARWMMADLVYARLGLAKANDEIVQLRAEIMQLKSRAVQQLGSGTVAPPSPLKHKEKTPPIDHGVVGVTNTSSSVTRPDTEPIVKASPQSIRTRIGIYTVAELEALGEEALAQLDNQVLSVSVKDLDADQFEYIFREAGLRRQRPEHYEFSEEEANHRFNDAKLTVNERNYYQMVQNCNMLVTMNWDNAWWVDRVLYRITMMEYLDWRGIERISSETTGQ